MEGVDLSIPVGGVVPWLGQMMGLTVADLPDNFVVVDGSIINRGGLNLAGDLSPFEGVRLPDTNGRSLVSTTNNTLIGTELGADSVIVPVSKANIPSSFKVKMSSTGIDVLSKSLVNNLALSSVQMIVEVKDPHAIGDGDSGMSVPQANKIDAYSAGNLPTGATYHSPHVFEGNTIWTTSMYSHDHHVNTTHLHSFRVYNYVQTNTTVRNQVGAGTGISVDTSHDNFNTAEVVYIMRIY
ncbi:hypothetical protein S140_123 [Shewanella sp. phage 1/40]|uniref:hypothetical protein n=1 Tax=Shewanella sp. phage 1/40 TaxID=1458860 RepID=UPI0004F593ED|nr:hypothetical protein S140_123 [Shewanella sp. phage 1/40]AHK11530.1 hypothetical protein S140_123 [Shewanella sp. phage 1/40]